MGGGAPNAKPKESAGKPAGADAGPGPAGSTGGAGATGAKGGSINGSTDEEAPALSSTLGEPKLGTGTISGGAMFSLNRNAPPSVRTGVQIAPDGATPVVRFIAKMSIDADGAGEAYRRDRTGLPQTALKVGGSSLNPTKTPYVVIPGDFSGPNGVHKDVLLGDYAAVTYGPRTVYAIVGDVGPRGLIGEGSILLARGLKIPDDPNTGGVGGNVQYLILPGSKDKEPPTDAARIQIEGKRRFDAAKIQVR